MTDRERVEAMAGTAYGLHDVDRRALISTVAEMDRLRNMVRELDEMTPDPKQFRVNHLTMIGRYSQQWKKIEESNKGPFGPLFAVIEDHHIPEGIVILLNLRPKNDPVIVVCDLREMAE